MNLTEIRALLKVRGYKAAAAIDRLDVKRSSGAIVGVDLMFTDGTVAHLSVS